METMRKRTAREREAKWDLRGKTRADARAPPERGPAPAPDPVARIVPAAPREPIMEMSEQYYIRVYMPHP